MSATKRSPILIRQLKKQNLSELELPKNHDDWKIFLDKISTTYDEFNEARICADNVLAVSLAEMELLQEEKSKLNADILKELNANLSVILQASELGIWDWYLNNNTVNYDDRWCEILGYKKDEIPQTLETFQNLVHPGDINRVMKMAGDYLECKIPKFDSTFQMRHKNGHWIHIHAKGKVIKFDDAGTPLRFMGTHSDITEEVRSQNEIEVQKNKLFHQSKLASMGEMSAGLAHEINNPLAIISGIIEILEDFKDQPEKFKAKLETIGRSCQRISKIVNGLKKFSRSGEETKLRLNNVSAIIDEAILLTNMKSTRINVPIFKDCDPDIMILCDDQGIEQVLINLINNAIDAVKTEDEKWIKIAVLNEDAHVTVRVIDSGSVSNVSRDIEEKIFNPFFTTKKVGEGTGLGLSISKGILDEHNATINLNRDFENTCFEIKFKERKDL